MEITEIKSRLTLSEVIKHYGFKADKHNRICCPFHEDKTPSLQLYYKTHTAYCFSANCSTHGHSMDVIEIVQRMEKADKHQAILKCVEMLNGNGTQARATQLTKTAVLTKMFTYFKNAVHNSPPAKEYLQSRNLDFKKIEVGYNAGQFHHGTRKEELLIKSCLEFGLLIDKNLVGRTGEKAYQPFGKWCVCFALRNTQNHVSGLYFRSTLAPSPSERAGGEAKHFYLKDRTGLYPHYPNTHTKKLILTEAIIDAASLLMDDAITNQYEILSAYGTNGLTEEHTEAIKNLQQLEEIIFFFDGDKAGKEAINKYGKALKEMLPQVKLSVVNTPENEDINSLLQGHTPEILQHLIKERTDFIFSYEILSVENKNAEAKLFVEQQPESEASQTPLKNKHDRLQNLIPTATEPALINNQEQGKHNLNTDNPHNIYFNGIAANYTIKGLLKSQLDSLKVSLQIIHKETKEDYRAKPDLYDYKQLQSLADTVADLLKLRKDTVEKDLQLLTHLLENYRDQYNETQPQQGKYKTIIQVPENNARQCIAFMQRKNLLQEFNKLIGKAGIVGEENNRLLLFIVASSYRMKETLHAMIQGSSGSGKTRLLKIIGNLMPPEDTKRLTRVTESSFYNYGEYDLVNVFICFEDADGLEEKALLAVRELQSNDILITLTTQKDNSNGHNYTVQKIVRGPMASIACTTKGEVYEDNMSRVFLIAVDEGKEKIKQVIRYQNEVAAGLIDKNKEKEVSNFIQNCMRLLKPYEVINPFANKIELPEDAHKIMRLNEMYQSIVKQVTILNQYQRKKDNQGRLITEKEDLQTACEILFESIILKVDELDGSLRQFYDKLKKFVNAKSKDYEFNRFEVRTATGVSKTQEHRYLQQLLNLEYIKQFGFANKGFKYKVAHWDNMAATRARIKDSLEQQLQAL